MAFVLSILAFLIFHHSEAVRANSYFTSARAEVCGLPDDINGFRFTYQPSSISNADLEELHSRCVARINDYRKDRIRFSDGTQDSAVAQGLEDLSRTLPSNDICSNAQSMGDLKLNVEGGGGCAGAHGTAFSCQSRQRNRGQNSCCGRGGGSFGSNRAINTLESVTNELYGCLQSMWDEGEVGHQGATGHWLTMRSSVYTEVSCGFAWTENGRVMMIQDFSNSETEFESNCPPANPTQAPPTKSPTKPPTAAPTKPPTASPTASPTEADSTASPTIAPPPTTAAPTGKPDPESYRGHCPDYGFNNHCQACDGNCWSPFSYIVTKIGNTACNDFAAYGLNFNCQHLNCDGGDCTNGCTASLGKLVNQSKILPFIPDTDPPSLDDSGTSYLSPFWACLIVVLCRFN